MSSVLIRAGCFAGLILFGFLLRKFGFFQKEDFHLLSKLVIKITLTAAIITNFSNGSMEGSMLILSLMGLGFGIVMMSAAYLVHIRDGRPTQAFAVLNSAGCNIGNFVLPFAQGFLGPTSVMAVSLFDMGNSFICLGGAYGTACAVKESGQKFRLLPILQKMGRSIPLITYICMTILSMLRIRLPAPILEFTGIIANANAFLAMLMIGVGFQLSPDRTQIRSLLRILVPRFALGIGLAVISFLFLPFPLEYRQALVIVFLAPIASAAPPFTAEMKGDYGLSCAINSLSILISIALIVTSLAFIL